MMICLHDLPRAGRIALAAATALLASGCGQAAQNGDSQVWGRVTARGKPVTEGVVILMPAAGSNVTWGAGALDANGRFQVAASRSDLPLLAGRYDVYIKAPTRVDPVAGKLVPPADYPVSQKYLIAEEPAIHIEIKDEPTKLELNLDD